MKKSYWIILFTLALALAACGQLAPTPQVVATTAPAVSAPVTNSSSGVVASAEVVPFNSVELSFPLTGSLTTVGVEVGDTVVAGQTLATLDTTILEAKVAEAEANVAAAETQVRYLQRVGSGAEQIDKARADVDRAVALVDQAKATLEQTSLITPVGGTVVSVDAAPGEVVTPGKIVFVIADLSRMRIETTDLSERDIPAVQIGQQAEVFVDALNETFQGKVVDIARQSATVGGDVVYKVTIELDKQPKGLRWGMSAEVDIQTEQ